MGSLCSKASSDNFAGQGRPVGSAPAPAGTASVPKSVKVGGPPRTLGGGPSQEQGGSAAGDARSRAAAAAEVRLRLPPSPSPSPSPLPSTSIAIEHWPNHFSRRPITQPSALTLGQARAQATKPSGKLGAKLEAQKKMSRNETLQAASSDQQRARELDASAAALRHD